MGMGQVESTVEETRLNAQVHHASIKHWSWGMRQ